MGRVLLRRLKVRVSCIDVKPLYSGSRPADHRAAHEWHHICKRWPLGRADDRGRCGHHSVYQRRPRCGRLARQQQVPAISLAMADVAEAVHLFIRIAPSSLDVGEKRSQRGVAKRRAVID